MENKTDFRQEPQGYWQQGPWGFHGPWGWWNQPAAGEPKPPEERTEGGEKQEAMPPRQDYGGMPPFAQYGWPPYVMSAWWNRMPYAGWGQAPYAHRGQYAYGGQYPYGAFGSHYPNSMHDFYGSMGAYPQTAAYGYPSYGWNYPGYQAPTGYGDPYGSWNHQSSRTPWMGMPRRYHGTWGETYGATMPWMWNRMSYGMGWPWGHEAHPMPTFEAMTAA